MGLKPALKSFLKRVIRAVTRRVAARPWLATPARRVLARMPRVAERLRGLMRQPAPPPPVTRRPLDAEEARVLSDLRDALARRQEHGQGAR